MYTQNQSGVSFMNFSQKSCDVRRGIAYCGHIICYVKIGHRNKSTVHTLSDKNSFFIGYKFLC